MLDPTSSRPLYQQLAQLFRRQIEDGVLRPGSSLESEAEIAEYYGISRGTVRQAFDLLVDDRLLERIQGKGTFVAGPAFEECVNRVGVIVPYLRESHVADIFRGIESVLRLHRYSLIYSPSEGNITVEADQIQRLQREKICGIILMPVSHNNEATQVSQAMLPGLPLVLIDRAIPGYETSGVFVDNIQGAREVVNHLLALGHRKIACIRETRYVSTIAERVRGYEEAMRSAGLLPLAALPLKWGPSFWEGSPPDFTEEEMRLMEILLNSPDRPTALFCINDYTAYRVMHYLLQKGTRIPQDVAIAGFDDLPLAAYMPVPLTTVSQPRFEIGVQAARLLLEIVERGPGEPRRITLPVSLVVRSSTAPS